MTGDEFIAARDLQIVHNEILRKAFNNKSCVMGSNEWENVDVETVFKNVSKYFNDWHTTTICAACWYMCESILNKMFELVEYSKNQDIKVFIIPEDYSIVFFKDKATMAECVSKLSKPMIESSMYNIVDVVLSDNGVEYVYSNKRVFKPYEEGVARWLTAPAEYSENKNDWKKQFEETYIKPNANKII